MDAVWRTSERASGTVDEHYDAIAAAARAAVDKHGAAHIDAADRALLDYTIRLAIAPRSTESKHLSPLTDAGLSDRDIADIVNVVACFSYMNRLADGLGVRVPGANKGWAVELLGDRRWNEHVQWADRRRALPG